MASDEADSAVTRALGVDELLEHVLVNLDLKNLERSRRVSRQWNTLITTSVNFHQTRFQSPVPITKTAHRENEFDPSSSIDRSTVLMGGVVSTDPIWHDRIGDSEGGGYLGGGKWDAVRAVAKLHPALDQAPGCQVLRNTMSPMLLVKPKQFKQWVTEGGWDQTFPTQPPPKIIHIGTARTVAEKHLTIGDIVRHVEQLQESGIELDHTSGLQHGVGISLSDVALEDCHILLGTHLNRPGYKIKPGKRMATSFSGSSW